VASRSQFTAGMTTMRPTIARLLVIAAAVSSLAVIDESVTKILARLPRGDRR